MKLASKRQAKAPRNRLEQLSKLPIFLDLADKPVLVAGGTAAAAWKAELLAAAGAHVTVYAENLSSEMSALIARGAAGGSIRHCPQSWSADVFADPELAIADAADEVEADAFYSAARAAGALVNVIDKPSFCQFNFGSIVNRSPVVIAISTDGGAPILAQAIRLRIEAVLPSHLALWGQRAKDMRDEVMRRFKPGAQRRSFWDHFVACAFALSNDAAAGECAIDDIIADTTQNMGKITLVGAGPGDAELLTLKAVRALQSADVILHDDGVSDEVLELARREATLMSLSKGQGRDLVCGLARDGKHVVRLVTGNPSLTGVAGRDVRAWTEAGIQVAVVQGIPHAKHSVRKSRPYLGDSQRPATRGWQGSRQPGWRNSRQPGWRDAMPDRAVNAPLANGRF